MLSFHILKIRRIIIHAIAVKNCIWGQFSAIEVHGNQAAGREYGVNERNIRIWRKQKDRLKKMPKTRKAERGSRVHHPSVEGKVVDLITERRKQGIAVSSKRDQTPMTFDPPTSTTIAPKGVKLVSINTGKEKTRFTVMLGCTTDGGKLPPFVIFNRKTLPKDFNPPKSILVRTQEKGWMDEPLFMDWIRNLWDKRQGAGLKKSMLVLDAFQRRQQDSKRNLVIIPGGMMSILQPLGVSVNRPLKQIMQRKWNEWYSSGKTHMHSRGGEIKRG